MGNFSIRFVPEEIRTISSATLTGSYQIVGSTFEHPIVLLKIVNNSDKLVDVSYDGDVDHDVVPAGGFVLYDVCANKHRVDGLQFSIGDGVYVSGTAGTGTIYVVSFYAGP